jgi:hypothetical protein
MSHLDLTEAIEAGVREMILAAGEDPDEHEFCEMDVDGMREESQAILAATLPHILEALANEAYATGLVIDGYNQMIPTAQWLRRKAEEVRG